MNPPVTVCVCVVVIAGTAIVFTSDPLRQTLVLGLYGFALTALFFAVQAPDVALSEIVVSGVGLPVIVLAALRKLGEQRALRARREGDREEAG